MVVCCCTSSVSCAARAFCLGHEFLHPISSIAFLISLGVLVSVLG
jgi:hypothetical protein